MKRYLIALLIAIDTSYGRDLWQGKLPIQFPKHRWNKLITQAINLMVEKHSNFLLQTC